MTCWFVRNGASRGAVAYAIIAHELHDDLTLDVALRAARVLVGPADTKMNDLTMTEFKVF